MANGPTLPPQAYTREVLAVAFQWLQGQPESIKKLAQSPDALVGLYLRAQRYGNASPENDAPVSSQNFISDLKNLAEGLKQFDDPSRMSSLLNSSFGGNSVGTNSVGTNSGVSNSMGMNSMGANSGGTASASGGPTIGNSSGLSLSSTRTSSMNMYSNSHSSNGPPTHGPIPQGLPHGLTHGPTPPHWAHSPTQTAASQTLTQPISGVSSSVSSGVSMPPANVDLACYLNPTAQAMIQEVKNHMNLSSDAEVLNMLIAIAYKHVKNLLG